MMLCLCLSVSPHQAAARRANHSYFSRLMFVFTSSAAARHRFWLLMVSATTAASGQANSSPLAFRSCLFSPKSRKQVVLERGIKTAHVEGGFLLPKTGFVLLERGPWPHGMLHAVGMGSGKTRLGKVWLRLLPFSSLQLNRQNKATHEPICLFSGAELEPRVANVSASRTWGCSLSPVLSAQLSTLKLYSTQSFGESEEPDQEGNQPFRYVCFSPNMAGPDQQKLEQNHPLPLPAPLYAHPSRAWSHP